MILDSQGRPLRRAIGFIGGFVVARKALPLVDALQVVGLQVPLETEEEELEEMGSRATCPPLLGFRRT